MSKKILHILFAFTLLATAAPKGHIHAQKPKGVSIGYVIQDNGDTLFADKIAPLYVFNRPDNWKKSRQWREYYNCLLASRCAVLAITLR